MVKPFTSTTDKIHMNINASGCFYIKINNSKTHSWSLYYQSFEQGKKTQKAVAKLAYEALGFRREMNFIEAKDRVKQLNKTRSIEKDKIRKSSANVTELKILDETIFPKTLVDSFLIKIENENFGSEEHFQKIKSHFNFMQKMLINLKIIKPSDYNDESKTIFKYFLKKKISVNYSKRIISLLNRWGKFQARHQGIFFEEIKPLRGIERSRISDSQKTKKGKNSELGVRTESEPLTPEILNGMKDSIPEEQYNWLYLSVWLGLRPFEIDLMTNAANYKIKLQKDSVYTISVYQTKLTGIATEKRWKHIPLIFKQQRAAIKIIESKKIKRPLSKIVRKYSKNDKITLYGGRKNFVDLCLDHGQDFVDIASWMGHKNTDITFKHYKNRDTIRYTAINENSSNGKIRVR